MDFEVPANSRIKLKEREKRDKYLDLARELKNKQTMEQEGDSDTNNNWRTRYSHQGFIAGTGGLGNKSTSGDHPSYCIVEISQITKKESWRLEETCCHSDSNGNRLLTLLGKTLKWVKWL